MILKAVERAYQRKAEKGWDKIYASVDIHQTICKSNYVNNDVVYYPHAKETLQLLTKMNSSIVLIIYSCSYHKSIAEYQKQFKKDGIVFSYFNANPEVEDTSYGCFSKGKFFIDFGIDDKFGFDPDTEWEILYNYFKNSFEYKLVEQNIELNNFDTVELDYLESEGNEGNVPSYPAKSTNTGSGIAVGNYITSSGYGINKGADKITGRSNP